MPWIDKEDTACRGKWSRTLPLTASSLAAAGVARAGQDRLDDPGAQKTLRTMNDASIRYRPDLFGQITRMSRYAHISPRAPPNGKPPSASMHSNFRSSPGGAG